MARFHVPIIVTVTGEGGSGGALALGIGDRVLMLEHSTYSVISPEGCASILWKDAARKKDAAEAMRLTAADLHGARRRSTRSSPSRPEARTRTRAAPRPRSARRSSGTSSRWPT